MARAINTILNLKDRFSQPLKKSTENTKKFTKQAKLASYQIKQLKTAATGAFTSMATGLAGLVAIDKLKNFGVSLVQSAATAQATSAQFEQVFGDMQDNAQKTVDAMGNSFGMVSSRLKPAFTTMSSMFKGLGLSTEDAMKQAEIAVTLAADAAAFYDKSYEDANGALNSFIKGNYEGGESIGLFANETQLAAWASKNLKKDWKKLDEAGKQIARLEYAKAMQTAAGATGQAARESDSLENQLGNLKATWENLKAKLGKPLLSPAIKQLKNLAEWVGKVDTDKIIEGFSKAGKKIKSISSKVLPELKNAWNEVKTPLKETIDLSIEGFKFIKENWSTIRPLVEGIAIAFGLYKTALIATMVTQEAHNLVLAASAFRTGGLAAAQTALAASQGSATVAQWALNTAMSANPIGFVITAIGLLIGAGILLYRNWDTVKAKAFELWGSLKTTFSQVGVFFTGLWQGIKSGFGEFVNFFVNGINRIIDGLNGIKVNVPKWIPGVGGKKFGVNISKVPAYASGTSYSKGGLAQIHEKGGELRQLSSGETIIPADKSKKIINNNNNTDSPIIIQIYGNVYGVDDLVNIVGSAISNRVKLARANM